MPKRLGFIAALLVLVSVSSQGAHAQATGGPGGPMGGGGAAPPTTPVGMGGGGGGGGSGGGAADYAVVSQELYVSFFGRPPDPTMLRLSLSGETVVGSQQTTFGAMNQFMNIMTGPSNDLDVAAAELAAAELELRALGAYAAIDRKAPPMAPRFEQRWNVWAAGFGGSQTTDGNAAVGSNNTTSSIYGTAVGADYRFSPDTRAGFALAGGGTNFGANNLGSGRSDLFQAGAYVRHTSGAAYITGALAYGWQDITTNRTVTLAPGFDQLRAEFNANAYSGRVEGGYRFVAPVVGGVGITPYAA
jgi:uncharacterized protein with beta-barrel porin domain